MFIAIALVVGLLTLLTVAVLKLGTLAENDGNAKTTFLKLTDPAPLILLGVLFLLGMAILDLDKGRVLAGMGKAPFARGLITCLFAVVTIGTAVVLVLSAILGVEKEKFDQGTERLASLENSSISILPGVGHVCCVEAPTVFNRIALNFIDRNGCSTRYLLRRPLFRRLYSGAEASVDRAFLRSTSRESVEIRNPLATSTQRASHTISV